ncbi:MAG: hypothetical protein QOH86_1201, partial [Sphingomonadales bacterium]|nr:hypothetical protein [Sphingomonadales bacterium]
ERVLRLEGEGGAEDGEGESEKLDGVPVDQTGTVDVAAAAAAMLEEQRQRGEGEEGAGGGPQELGGGKVHRPKLVLRAGDWKESQRAARRRRVRTTPAWTSHKAA